MSSALRAAFFFALVQVVCTASAAPCVAPPSACIEWVNVAGGPARAMVYRNHPIDVRNDAITHALIVIHGRGRDADNYYRHALAAGFLAAALDKTLIIAPRFASNDGSGCRDSLAQDELNWVCRGPVRWHAGGASLARDDITSFDVLDEILHRLARREVFPKD